MSTYAAVGNRQTAQRMIQAEESFIAQLMKFGGITDPEACKVLAVYRKAKCVSMDIVNGTMSVKHGALLDADVINRALEQHDIICSGKRKAITKRG